MTIDAMTSFANTAAVASRTLTQRLRPFSAGGWTLRVAEVRAQSLEAGEKAQLPLLLVRGGETHRCGFVDFFANQCRVDDYKQLVAEAGGLAVLSAADYEYLVEQLRHCVAPFNLNIVVTARADVHTVVDRPVGARPAAVSDRTPLLLGLVVVTLIVAALVTLALSR